jgi:uncharacterized protein (DUF2062 family)
VNDIHGNLRHMVRGYTAPMRGEYERVLREWLLRRKRVRRLLRPLPRRANVHRYPVIKWFAEHAQRRPELWSFKRAQILPALYAGSVISLLPLYGIQIVIAFAAALLLRANLTVMVALQFVTNPLTVVPVYAFTGWVGATLMRALGIGEQLPTAAFYANALFIGGVIVGLLFAVLADIAWRVVAWEARAFTARMHRLRRQAAQDKASSAPASQKPSDPTI